jgi:antitoxin component YwqK of YwqJK toxin-antitoxin module
MKSLYFLPFLFFILMGCSEKKTSQDISDNSITSNVQPNDVLVQYYESGQPKYSQEFLNGIRHGDYNHWFKDGKVQSNGKYYMGMRNGTWQWFDEKGSKTLEVNYGNSLARL